MHSLVSLSFPPKNICSLVFDMFHHKCESVCVHAYALAAKLHYAACCRHVLHGSSIVLQAVTQRLNYTGESGSRPLSCFHSLPMQQHRTFHHWRDVPSLQHYRKLDIISYSMRTLFAVSLSSCSSLWSFAATRDAYVLAGRKPRRKPK